MAQSNNQSIIVGLSLAAITSLILYQIYQQKNDSSDEEARKRAAAKSRGLPSIGSTPAKKSAPSDTATPLANNTSGKGEKALHHQIEELDKKGKGLFKAKNYLAAADAFTSALDLIANNGGSEKSTSLARQVVTLTNNRSAMYEKGGLAELALADCQTILEADASHTKARTRTLRVLEAQERYAEALVQVCALQLKFMQDNRAQLRMGVQLQPPVPQQKLEEMIAKLLPGEVEKYVELAKAKKDRPLPSQYTLTQLLKSFSGYNAWMSQAAKDGNVGALTKALEEETDDAKKASLYLKRGRRHVHDKSYEKAPPDFEAGLNIIESNTALQDVMENDDYARLLEWVGMVRHWKYNLDGALQVYEACSALEPTNVSFDTR